ncbi:uncharacterized protein V1518DRAFT_210943 [Limtongia smithiae]|uniref:uncharacterized protein n=1 Tax=Limtongia smithiae TaxID=1125753 RepID=UPI0034CD24F1
MSSLASGLQRLLLTQYVHKEGDSAFPVISKSLAAHPLLRDSGLKPVTDNECEELYNSMLRAEGLERQPSGPIGSGVEPSPSVIKLTEILYLRYRTELVLQVRQDEHKYRQYLREIEEIGEGEWDTRLHELEEIEKHEEHHHHEDEEEEVKPDGVEEDIDDHAQEVVPATASPKKAIAETIVDRVDHSNESESSSPSGNEDFRSPMAEQLELPRQISTDQATISEVPSTQTEEQSEAGNITTSQVEKPEPTRPEDNDRTISPEEPELAVATAAISEAQPLEPILYDVKPEEQEVEDEDEDVADDESQATENESNPGIQKALLDHDGSDVPEVPEVLAEEDRPVREAVRTEQPPVVVEDSEDQMDIASEAAPQPEEEGRIVSPSATVDIPIAQPDQQEDEREQEQQEEYQEQHEQGEKESNTSLTPVPSVTEAESTMAEISAEIAQEKKEATMELAEAEAEVDIAAPAAVETEVEEVEEEPEDEEQAPDMKAAKKRRRRDSSPSHVVDDKSNSAAASTLAPSRQTNRKFQTIVAPLLSNISSNRSASFFTSRVNENDAPDYYNLIHQPTDLRTIKAMVKDGRIQNSSELEREVMKMFANAVMYNSWDSDISEWSREMQRETETLIAVFRGAERRGQNSTNIGGDSPAIGTSTALPDVKRRKK